MRLLLVAVFAAASSILVSGQQPNRKPQPYVAPLLPAQPAWEVTLAAPPAAAGAMDLRHVYVPLQRVFSTMPDGDRMDMPGSAAVVAVDRETGALRWKTQVAATVAPVPVGGVVLVAATADLHALSAFNGFPIWSMPLESAVRAPMLLRGNLLVALTSPSELVGIRIDTREVAWRRDVGETGTVLMNADARAVYLTTAGGRAMAVRLADGTVAWERKLEAGLSEPGIGRDRVLIGSTANGLWALDADSGKVEWRWAPGRIFGGDVIGAAVDEDTVYVASLDNILRALNRGNGNQRWKKDIGTRPVFPPRAFFGTVVVTGLAPTIATFAGKTGAQTGMWAAPAEAELEGPPLIDEHLKPYRVAMVVITRDGRVTALRPSAMLFAELPAVATTTLPGRALPIERPPGEPRPAPVVAPLPPRR